MIVNQKRVYGVMKAADLLAKPNPKLRAKRKAATTKRRPTRPNEWWGIDMPKVMIEGFGWSIWSWCSTGTPRKSSGTMLACRPAPGTGWWL